MNFIDQLVQNSTKAVTILEAASVTKDGTDWVVKDSSGRIRKRFGDNRQAAHDHLNSHREAYLNEGVEHTRHAERLSDEANMVSDDAEHHWNAAMAHHDAALKSEGKQAAVHRIKHEYHKKMHQLHSLLKEQGENLTEGTWSDDDEENYQESKRSLDAAHEAHRKAQTDYESAKDADERVWGNPDHPVNLSDPKHAAHAKGISDAREAAKQHLAARKSDLEFQHKSHARLEARRNALKAKTESANPEGQQIMEASSRPIKLIGTPTELDKKNLEKHYAGKNVQVSHSEKDGSHFIRLSGHPENVRKALMSHYYGTKQNVRELHPEAFAGENAAALSSHAHDISKSMGGSYSREDHAKAFNAHHDAWESHHVASLDPHLSPVEKSYHEAMAQHHDRMATHHYEHGKLGEDQENSLKTESTEIQKLFETITESGKAPSATANDTPGSNGQKVETEKDKQVVDQAKAETKTTTASVQPAVVATEPAKTAQNAAAISAEPMHSGVSQLAAENPNLVDLVARSLSGLAQGEEPFQRR